MSETLKSVVCTLLFYLSPFLVWYGVKWISRACSALRNDFSRWKAEREEMSKKMREWSESVRESGRIMDRMDRMGSHSPSRIRVVRMGKIG